MEIKIDTKKDSVDDIKKMISFLQKFIDETPSYSSYGNDNDSNDDFSIPATSMFDSTSESTTETHPEPEDDDSVKIIEY